MKIAMIGHKRVPSREGGVEIVVEELSVRMASKGHTIDVYNRKGNNVLDNNIKTKKIKKYKNVNIKTIFTINKKGLDAFIYSLFSTFLAIFRKYDIIHYHAEGSCAVLWLPHLFKIKTVVTIHGLDWKRSKWGKFASKYIKFGEKMAVKYANIIIVLSKDTQEYFEKNYGIETVLLDNGINKPNFRESEIIKNKYNLNKNDYILFLARIVPEKGLHYLLEAFNKLKTTKKLVIAGGASHTDQYYNNIKEMQKENKNIIFTGYVEKEELEELYSNCLIYCLPSDLEGMPISLLEALSYDCNCLVSDIPENVCVAKQYLNTFKAGDANDLKIKMESLIKIENRNPEISNYILKKYNWDRITNELEELYKCL